MPWGQLQGLIELHYPKIGGGRPPYALSTTLRIHCLQQWYGLSDPTMEEALYEIASLRQFAGLLLARGAADGFSLLSVTRWRPMVVSSSDSS